MSHSLDLPESIYEALTHAAASSGTTPVGWIAAHLPVGTVKLQNARTLADLFSGKTGRIASGQPSRFSENCGDRFAASLEDAHREGIL